VAQVAGIFAKVGALSPFSVPTDSDLNSKISIKLVSPSESGQHNDIDFGENGIPVSRHRDLNVCGSPVGRH